MVVKAKSEINLPRVAITFCTKCKWNLRAAYYAQELLQTFGDSLGEVALIPTSGGIFTIVITHESPSPVDDDRGGSVIDTLIWDRKSEGFPETKELKNRVRNIVEPGKDLGHIDRGLKKAKGDLTSVQMREPQEEDPKEREADESTAPLPPHPDECQDCK